VADHRGIRSLGYIMATGTAACMLAALTFLPAVLTLMERRRAARAAAKLAS
jgi:predicted RND superfamily exporter protein